MVSGDATATLRVLFVGTPEVALPSLRVLLEDPACTVVGVLTNPDRPRGRSDRPEPSPVAVAAAVHGLPLLRPERASDAVDAIGALAPDVAVVVAYGALLPTTVLEVPRLGFVNLHFSLLPRWRGAAPVQHAIRAGDPATGVSVFVLDDGMDTGPMLRQVTVPIGADEDAGDLLERLAELGAPVLRDAVHALAAGEVPTPQPELGATRAGKLTPADAVIDWTGGADEVARNIRSVSPRPGARTLWNGGALKLRGPAAVPGRAAPAGTVIASDDGALVVACGTGALRLAEVQPAGARWASSEDFVRGHPRIVGAVLGASAPAS
jgi:methionyl-tRNA formyltransferase